MRLSPTPFVFLLALPVLANARPVRNSFINRPVGSTSDLIAHVEKDRIVADRYRRHFAMDRSTLLRFLSGLHRGRLTRDGIYTIYSVPKGEWLKMHVGRLKKGEAMFLSRTGKPILVAKCGNPVVLGPSRPRLGNPAAIVPTEQAKTRILEDEAALAEAPLDLTVALVPPTLEPDVPTEIFAEAPMALSETTSTVPALGLGSQNFLGSLPLFAPLLTFIPGGHSDTIPAVPEPATLVVLAGGAAILTRRRRRSR